MNFLLDTNVVSEWTKPRPDAGVVAWLAEADEDRIFISVITVAELRHGIERLPAGARRERLDSWLTDQVPLRFDERLLPVDAETANLWGRVMAQGQAAGRPPGTMDAFIAATVPLPAGDLPPCSTTYRQRRRPFMTRSAAAAQRQARVSALPRARLQLRNKSPKRQVKTAVGSYVLGGIFIILFMRSSSDAAPLVSGFFVSHFTVNAAYTLEVLCG